MDQVVEMEEDPASVVNPKNGYSSSGMQAGMNGSGARTRKRKEKQKEAASNTHEVGRG